MTISLLLGNGVNRLSNENVSWEEVVQKLTKTSPTQKELKLRKATPFALLYEQMVLSSATDSLVEDELQCKRQVASLLAGLRPNHFHEQLVGGAVKHILTTNYDYTLEGATRLKVLPKNLQRESKYSVFRRKGVGDAYIWHIHGEVSAPASITLGYDHYSGYLQKLRTYATADRTAKGNSPFKRQQYDFDRGIGPRYCWLDVFFRDDIHIVGLTLDYTEIDLWWALTYKARLKARGWKTGRTYFHDGHRGEHDESGSAKQSLLRALSVDVFDKRCNDTQEFEHAYSSFISDVLPKE